MTINRWVHTVWYLSTMEYYLEIKRNEVVIHATTWMDLEIVMLSERSQYKRLHIVWFHLYEVSRTAKSIETESTRIVSGARRNGWWGVTANGYRVSFRVMKMFWDSIVVMVAQFFEYTKNQSHHTFKWVNMMLCYNLHKAFEKNRLKNEKVSLIIVIQSVVR